MEIQVILLSLCVTLVASIDLGPYIRIAQCRSQCLRQFSVDGTCDSFANEEEAVCSEVNIFTQISSASSSALLLFFLRAWNLLSIKVLDEFREKKINWVNNYLILVALLEKDAWTRLGPISETFLKPLELIGSNDLSEMDSVIFFWKD